MTTDFPCILISIQYIYRISFPNNLIATVLVDFLHTEPLRRTDFRMYVITFVTILNLFVITDHRLNT